MSVGFAALACVIVGLVFVIWPATMMAWHQKGWSLVVGNEFAEGAAKAVFMPPRFIYPRVLGAAFVALGAWLMVER